MLERFPAGSIRERHTVQSAAKLSEIVQRLRDRPFTGMLRLRWPDCEALLILVPGSESGAYFEAGGTVRYGQDALRHVLEVVDRRRAELEVVELPSPLGPVLRRLSRAEILHRGLSTEFIDLARLDRRLREEGFRGLVVVQGSGWWTFLPFPEEEGALYYDREAASERDRSSLLRDLAAHSAEIDVWVAPTEPPAQPVARPAGGWSHFRGDEVFIAAPGTDPTPFGPLAAEVVRLLDGTRTLDGVAEELKRPPAELEPILLSFQQQKWIYRYVRGRRPGDGATRSGRSGQGPAP